MSQPDDKLSSHNLLMSRQTIISHDVREKCASMATFNSALNLMTKHNCGLKFKSRQVQINEVIKSLQ